MSSSRQWWALVVLCISLVVVTVQTSILNVALPTLVRSIGASDSQLQWIVDSYIVAFAGMLLTGAALADRLGRRGVMAAGLVVCGASSVAAALSHDATELILWRAVMGVGAALVMPATLSILVSVFTDRRQRSRAIAYWSLMNATGAFIGPLAGGLLLRWTSWHFCFYVTLPLIVAALVMGHFLVPTSRDPSAARFDVLGAVLSTGGLGTLVWGLIEAPAKGWTDFAVVVSFALAIVLTASFIKWELHTPEPMLDLPTFRNPQLSAAIIALTVAFLALTSAMYLASLSLQLVKGYTPLAAAVATSVPVTAVNFLVVPAAPRLIQRFGTRRMVSAGTALISASALVIATMTVKSGYLDLFIGFALMALAFSIFVPASTEAIMTAVPPERSGGASAASQLTRQVGQALGIALGGGITAVGYHAKFSSAGLGLNSADDHKAHSSLTGALSVAHQLAGSTRDALLLSARDAYLFGVRTMLIVAAGLALCGALYAALAIPAKRRDEPAEPFARFDPLAVDPIGIALEVD